MNLNFDEAIVVAACISIGAAIAYNMVPLTVALLIVLLVLAYKGKIVAYTPRKKQEPPEEKPTQ